MSIKFLKWLGTAGILSGMLMLALNTEWSGYGWLAYIIGSGSWVIAGSFMKEPSIVIVNVGALCIHAIGIWYWL